MVNKKKLKKIEFGVGITIYFGKLQKIEKIKKGLRKLNFGSES